MLYKVKYIKTLLFLLCCSHQLLWSTPMGGSTVQTVVIDAGHGGKDPGAIGPSRVREKDLTLKMALMLGNMIKEKHPDVRVIYTRSTDVFLELYERAEIANRAKADLFISIHINAATNSTVKGSSTYVLGLHRSEANLEVAKRENAVIELEADRDKNYDFNPNTPEGHIIMSMKQNAFLEQSISMASRIEDYQDGSAENRKTLGVKQAGFYVLYKTAMPSILTELGFISNSWEEKYLASEEGQKTIAWNLYQAFADYKNDLEGIPVKRIRKPEPEITPPAMEVEKSVEKNPDTISAEITIPTKDTEAGGVVFRIQLGASAKPGQNILSYKNKNGKLITERLPNGINRFMWGEFQTLAEAEVQLKTMKKDFPDAFLTGYKDGKRLSPKELSSYQ
jgi:N-acetylmuramoyl-L-alanine amidase